MKGLLQEPVANDKIQCNVCAHRCKLGEGQTGICRVRKNVGGEIQYLAYNSPQNVCPLVGNCAAGTFCASPPSCNWSCSFCTSAAITMPEVDEAVTEAYDNDTPLPLTSEGYLDQRAIRGKRVIPLPMAMLEAKPPDEVELLKRDIGMEPSQIASPTELVEAWKRSGEAGFGMRGSEPIIHLEAVIETFSAIREAGGFVLINTNGYWTPESLELLAPHIDQVEIGFKGSGNPEFMRKVASVPKMEPVYETIKGLAQYPIDILISDVPVLHETWEDDFRALSKFISETLPPRDFPRLKLYPWKNRIPQEAFGKFVAGRPTGGTDSKLGYLGYYAHLEDAARIALEHLDSVWFSMVWSKTQDGKSLLNSMADLAVAEEGAALVRVAKTPEALGHVLVTSERLFSHAAMPPGW